MHTIQRVHVGWGGVVVVVDFVDSQRRKQQSYGKNPTASLHIYRDHIPFLFRFWILHDTKFLCYEVLSITWLFAPYEKSPFINKIIIALILFLPGLPNFTAYKVIWKLEISINMYVDCLKRDHCKLIMYWFELK